MSILLRAALVVALASPVLAIAGSAQAHARLAASTPAKDATVAAPATILLQFSERLEPKFSTATLMTLAGKDVPVTASVKDKTIEAAPKQALAPGGYMVMWKVVSADGHKISGDYNFTVR